MATLETAVSVNYCAHALQSIRLRVHLSKNISGHIEYSGRALILRCLGPSRLYEHTQ